MAVIDVVDQDGLAALAAALAGRNWVALDTEFLRVRTYYPRLCLLQIHDGEDSWLVDAPALGSLEPLRGMLLDPAVKKVLHSARQDLETLHRAIGAVPAPVWDTQIASALLGYGLQTGYGALVEKLTGRTLPKAHTRADWCRRPLSPELREYAIDDVVDLAIIFQLLEARLAAEGRLDWLVEECARLTDPAVYRSTPEDAWRGFGAGAHLAPGAQHRLRALIVWRESVAQSRDLPRAWIVPDSGLIAMARTAPASADELAATADVPEPFARRYAATVLRVLRDAHVPDPAAIWETTERLGPEERNRVNDLLDFLRRIAENNHIAPELLATRRDAEQVIRGRGEARLFRGWRRQLVGDLSAWGPQVTSGK
jgi:ribonuclease D